MSELRADFTALKTSATGRYDPVRLRYIESLLQRWESSAGKRAQRLERRLRQSLTAYRAEQPAALKVDPARVQPGQSGLAQLLEMLSKGGDHELPQLEQALRQQELDLVGAIASRSNAPEASRLRREELQAARRFHSAMVSLNANRVVASALEDVPEDCGPLNPQRLATRSLAAMRDLSPHYLSRFVSYIDTLFWLEQAERNAGQ